MSAAEKLMTIAQAAEQCACHPRTLRRAIDMGELAACRLGQGPKSDRIHPVDLAVWLGKCKAKTVCPSPSAPMALTKLPSASADELLESRLGIGRSRTRGHTSRKCSPQSRTLRLVENRND